MQANWSLILNIVLLVGVIFAIARLMKARRENFLPAAQPNLGAIDAKPYDDIIAVRRLNSDPLTTSNKEELPFIKSTQESTPSEAKPANTKEVKSASEVSYEENTQGQPIMLFLQAKENRQLAGYELLQTVLSAGLRFGEGQLFHRHQHANGQGPILCSLAAATATGTFDLQNIGAFSVRGLCLFMQASGNPTIDAERLMIMFDTARQLNEGLDTRLLDDQQKLLTDESIFRYGRMLNIPKELMTQ